MEHKKTKALILATSLFALLAIVGSQVIRAQDSGNHQPLVQRLTERFNLDAGEVEEVLSQHRGEMKAQGQARFEERLNQAVEEGRITEEQKQAFLQKKAQWQEECQGLSFEERGQKREEHQAEMRSWLEENGIDLGQLGGFGRHQFGPKD